MSPPSSTPGKSGPRTGSSSRRGPSEFLISTLNQQVLHLARYKNKSTIGEIITPEHPIEFFISREPFSAKPRVLHLEIIPGRVLHLGRHTASSSPCKPNNPVPSVPNPEFFISKTTQQVLHLANIPEVPPYSNSEFFTSNYMASSSPCTGTK